MNRSVLAGACLLAAVVLGALAAPHLAPKPVPAAEAAPAAFVPPLEPGKLYTFTWPQQTQMAEVVEAPRGSWVKVKSRDSAQKLYLGWYRLDTLLHVQEHDPIE